MVTGMHLAPEFGLTVDAIEADGFPIADRVEMLCVRRRRRRSPKSIGRGVIGLRPGFAGLRPDILSCSATASRCTPPRWRRCRSRIPVAHIHGGELTEGAIDDALRHSMTKLSHLHFVATEATRAGSSSSARSRGG